MSSIAATNLNNNIYAKFYSAIGNRVFISESSAWIEIQRGMLISVPFPYEISPSKSELENLIRRSGVLGVRYATSKSSCGFPSSRIVCRNVNYGYANLNSKARNQVRKGQKYCEIKDVSYDDLLVRGLELNRKTFARQDRADPKGSMQYWKNICKACFSVAGVRVSGAYVEDTLAAYVIVLESGDMAEIVIQNSDSDLLKHCPNNALTFEVAKRYLSDSSSPVPVYYGLASLEETKSLDHFKLSMGFQFENVKQALVFRRSLDLILNRKAQLIMQYLQNHVLKKSYIVRKVNGLLNKYLEQA